MVDLGVFADKLAGNLTRAIRKAEQVAQEQGHTCLTPEHAVTAIAETEPALFRQVLTTSGHDHQQKLRGVQAKLGAHQNKNNDMGLSQEMRELLHYSLTEAHQHDRRQIEPEDMLRVYFADKPSPGEKLKNLFSRGG